MNVAKICEDYLNVKLETAIKKPELLYKLIVILQAKRLSIKEIAETIGVKVDTIARYIERNKLVYNLEFKPLSVDQQQRINKFLKIEHLNK
jgi:IS30 family transposase